MSGNDVSTAETAQSDQYLPTTPQQQQCHRYYNKAGTPKHQQQQQQPQQQHQQQCARHISTQQQQPPTPNLVAAAVTATAAMKWQQRTCNNSSEFDEYHWQRNQSKQQQQQHHQQQQQHNNCNYNTIGGVGSKVYITPADIPPPPPHPPSTLGNKKFNNTTNIDFSNSNNNQTTLVDCHHHHQQQQQQQQPQYQPTQQPPPHTHHHLQHQQSLPVSLPPLPHRCKCDHSIEILHPTTPVHHKHHHHKQQQSQQQQQQHRQHHLNGNYDDDMNSEDSDMDCSHGGVGSVADDIGHNGDIIITADSRHHHGPPPPPPHLHLHHTQRPMYHYANHVNAGTQSGQYLQNLQRNPAQLHGKLHSSMLTAYDGAGDHGDHSRRFKNLVYSKEKIRKIRIILSIVVAIIIVCLLATALVFIIGADDTTGNGQKPGPGGDAIDLEDILSGQLYAKRFNGSWSRNSNIIYKNNHDIVEFDVKTNKTTTLLVNAQQYVLYEKSADGQLLLLTKNYKKNFRHSYIAEYDILDISTGKITALTIRNEPKFLVMVMWAPVGNGLIINYERNLYYKPTAFATEIQLTSDDNPAISNGIPDWVYEEEVFSSNTATWFNPTGTQVAFIRFDDSSTHVINVPFYGEAGDLRYQYPYNHLIAYPKAGSPNPRVQLFTVDLERATSNSDYITEVPVPSALNTETDYIISAVSWLNNTSVLSIWMNRIQNLAYLQVFDGLKRYEIHNIESKTGWVELFTTPFKNRDGSRIALTLSQPQTEGGDYRHLSVMSTTGPNGKVDALTKGHFVVDSIQYWDPNTDLIFYLANKKQNPEVLHLYAIKATTDQNPQCLTCNLHTSGGIVQEYFSADFNSENQIIINSLGPGIPMVAIYEWQYSNNRVTLTKLKDWENNEHLREKLKNISMPTHEIHSIPIANDFSAQVLLQLPPNLDRSGKTKYPMLVDVYGGPSSYSVVNKWGLDWGTYLSSNQSVIYAKIDGRGSGLRGDKLLHAIYLKLGTVEIADQINVTRQLQEKFKFIDAEHTAIWGWSYGGYAAAMALANDDQHVFKCAASVAPVTDWAYYDSIYTERYMSLPKSNEAGYEASRLSTRAQRLRGKKYMLIHGTLDDNVHYQQAMILAKNLERHDILFKQISYTDEDHGLVNVRPHLYHSLDRFFGECFANNRLMMSAK